MSIIPDVFIGKVNCATTIFSTVVYDSISPIQIQLHSFTVAYKIEMFSEIWHVNSTLYFLGINESGQTKQKFT